MFARLEALEEKQDGQHDRVQNRQDRLEAAFNDMRRDYVTEKSLGYQLANINATLGKLEKALNWFVTVVIGSFVAAVARIVYVTTK